jgi:hypothetical protein
LCLDAVAELFLVAEADVVECNGLLNPAHISNKNRHFLPLKNNRLNLKIQLGRANYNQEYIK